MNFTVEKKIVNKKIFCVWNIQLAKNYSFFFPSQFCFLSLSLEWYANYGKSDDLKYENHE